MKPASFDYVRADSCAEAVERIGALGGDARILAGGQSLMAVLNMRLAQPSVLVDISRTQDLNYVRVEKDRLAIGASATQASVEWRTSLLQEVPLLAQAFPYISHFQVRNRGTLCGSIAHADPSAEIPLVLAALGGEVVLSSSRGSRVLEAKHFFQGMLTTARESDELVSEVRFPLAKPSQRTAFAEFSARHGDFAIVSIAVVSDERELTIAVGGVADRPMVKHWPAAISSDDLVVELNDFAWELEAQDDAHASAQFRRHLTRQLGAQVIHKVREKEQ